MSEDAEWLRNIAGRMTDRGFEKRLRRIAAGLESLEEANAMACCTPPDGCDCAGCSYAAEVHAEHGSKS